MYAIRLTYKGGKNTVTRLYENEIARQLFSEWAFDGEAVEMVELLDDDFGFVVDTKYNMAIKRLCLLTCRGVTRSYFDILTALEDKQRLEGFFDEAVQFRIVNG